MKQIEEIIDFIEETGDKCVIIHQQKGAYVVLKAEEYRKLFRKNKADQKNAELIKPETDVRIYEIPRRADQPDEYLPEPLD